VSTLIAAGHLLIGFLLGALSVVTVWTINGLQRARASAEGVESAESIPDRH